MTQQSKTLTERLGRLPYVCVCVCVCVVWWCSVCVCVCVSECALVVFMIHIILWFYSTFQQVEVDGQQCMLEILDTAGTVSYYCTVLTYTGETVHNKPLSYCSIADTSPDWVNIALYCSVVLMWILLYTVNHDFNNSDPFLVSSCCCYVGAIHSNVSLYEEWTRICTGILDNITVNIQRPSRPQGTDPSCESHWWCRLCVCVWLWFNSTGISAHTCS